MKSSQNIQFVDFNVWIKRTKSFCETLIWRTAFIIVKNIIFYANEPPDFDYWHSEVMFAAFKLMSILINLLAILRFP